MNEKEKDLLIKDLCARLPYGVKAHIKNWSNLDRKYYEGVYTVESIDTSLDSIFADSESNSVEGIVGDDYEIKPYLFPMSSMTEEQYNEFFSYYHNIEMDEVEASGDYLKAAYLGDSAKYEWLNRNHFDWRYLIDKGIAIDATGLSIY